MRDMMLGEYRRRAVLVAVLAVAALRAGAAHGQDVTPKIDDPRLAPIAEPRRVLGSWDEILTLERARSIELRVAYDEVTRAEGQSRLALAAALPVIGAQGQAVHNFLVESFEQPTGTGPGGAPITKTITVPPANYIDGTVALTQPLLALQAWHTIGTAHRNEEVLRMSAQDLKRQISLGVTSAVVGVLTAERLAEINRLGLRTALERLDFVQRKRLAGAASGIDTVRAQQDVEAARITLVVGDETLRQAREALGLAVGLPEQVGVKFNLQSVEQSVLRTCPAAATLQQRSDVVAARLRVEVAERLSSNVSLQYLPTIGVQTAVSSTTRDTGSAPNTTWAVQGLVNVPIWDGGARYGQKRSADALADEARLGLEQIERNGTLAITQARRAVVVANDAFEVVKVARALAAETERLAQAAFRAGQGSSLELVLAAAALRQAEIELTLREGAVVRARLLAVLTLANCTW